MNERVIILHEANVISEKTFTTIRKIEEEYFERIIIEDDIVNMFFIHLAMSIERIYKGEPILESEANLIEDIIESEFYEEACKTIDGIEKIIDKKIPEAEKIYLLLHLCNILQIKEG